MAVKITAISDDKVLLRTTELGRAVPTLNWPDFKRQISYDYMTHIRSDATI